MLTVIFFSFLLKKNLVIVVIQPNFCKYSGPGSMRFFYLFVHRLFKINVSNGTMNLKKFMIIKTLPGPI